MIAAIVLAAGASTRFGQPKQLAILGNQTLLERAVRTAGEAGCKPVVVVLGAEADTIRERCHLDDAIVVVNDDWAEGMASSIRAGVAAIEVADGAIVMTCDQPAVTVQHLRALIASGGVTASSYAGRSGVPAYFPMEFFPALRNLTGDSGAREILHCAAAVELENGELDVDTGKDLALARKLFA
ncbi:MAG: nucleotidyltransferase family protein [Acidobacteriota bacterium]|nr:nucleotidyltransferase family protein [Acidobacteriota bacterium]